MSERILKMNDIKLTRRNFLIGTGTTVGAAMIAPHITFAEEGSILVPHDQEVITPALDIPIDIHEEIKQKFSDILESMRFEINDSMTRNEIYWRTKNMLQEYKFTGELYNYNVICGETNNTPSLIDNHGLRAEVFYRTYPSINYHYIIGEAY